jgi:lipoic acid synthetase
MTLLRARWLGRMAYQEAWDLQKAVHEGRATGRTPDDYLLLLEHPHTYTVGRAGKSANVLVSDERLASLGASLHHIDRGGDVTYHGPGQLVGYPIVHLGDRPDVVVHVRRMEQALILALGDLGVEAWAEEGYTGVWTAQGKVAAIGLRLARKVTMHGFALNVSPDLEYFRHIVPCGIPDRPVASVAGLLGRRVPLTEAASAVARRFAEILGYPRVESQAVAPRSPAQAGHQAEGSGRLLPGEPERPEWMRVRFRAGDGYRDLRRLVHGAGLNTVCESAGCPNISECWAAGTATFMLLGDVCTRACTFCGVGTGRPGPVDETEPARVAEAVARLGISHAVLTSVTRDDLADGGASAFAATTRGIRRSAPSCRVEALIPDFAGDAAALSVVTGERPDVLNHNLETVLALQSSVRPSAGYGRSLTVLARAGWAAPGALVKSGLIVGLGEEPGDVLGAIADLRAVGVAIVTIGQYLRPTARHRPVHRYVTPDEFDSYREYGEALGLARVEAGPLVRSSYHARQVMSGAQ